MADYTSMTGEEFDEILVQILDERPASHLLSVGGVYELVAEEYNNLVLDEWASRNPEKAWKMLEEDE